MQFATETMPELYRELTRRGYSSVLYKQRLWVLPFGKDSTDHVFWWKDDGQDEASYATQTPAQVITFPKVEDVIKWLDDQHVPKEEPENATV